MPQGEVFSEQRPLVATEAEQSVLGAMLVDPTVIPQVHSILKPDDFYSEKHQILYQSIIAVAQQGPVDLVTMQDYLRRQEVPGRDGETLLEYAGGLTYLTSLMNLVPTVANVEHHARIVEERATLRRLQLAARQIADETQTIANAEAAIARAEAALQKVIISRSGAQPLEGFEGISDWIREYATSDDDDLLPTGLDDLDEVLEIRRGGVYGLMGPPKMGKSTVARQMALNQAEDGLHVLFVSLEENRTAQRLNFVALRAGVSKELLRRKWIKPEHEDWPKVEVAARRLDGLPIRFDFTPSQNVAQICAKIRYYALTWGVDVVYIDTGQAVDEERRRDERGDERFTRMVREWEAVAKVANCAVIVVIQGKQDVLTADSYFLTPMHISDSRGMVQAFTAVIGVMRPEKIVNPKASITYRGQKLFAVDKRWRNVMALFTVASRTNEENVITPVYCDMRTGRIANLWEWAWPWRSAEEKVPGPDAIRGRIQREPRRPRKPATEPQDTW